MWRNRPDDLVHRRVGEKRLVQLIVTPLTVAEQVQDDVFSEESLVFYGQPSGSQHLLCVIAIDVDNSTIHHFTYENDKWEDSLDGLLKEH